MERSPLVFAGGALAGVVETRLADRRTARVGGQRSKLGQVGLVEPARRIGMTPDGGVDLRKRFRGGQRRPAGGAVDADGQDAPHAVALGRGHQLPVVGLAEVEMGVAVDHA